MSVTATFDFDQREYYRGLRAVMRRNPYWWLIPVLGIVLPLGMIWLAVGRRWHQVSAEQAILSALPWALLGTFYLALVPMMARSAARRALENDPSLRGTQTRIIDDAGLHVRGAGFAQDFAWSDIVRVVESPDFFLLFYNKRMAHYVPKRALSTNEIQAARELIARYLPDRSASPHSH